MDDPAVPPVDARRRTPRGERSRAAILETAARLATVEGLEGLSIGRLAEELRVSKSGLYAHFESKEALQLGAIDTAVAMYTRAIVEPALALPPGQERLLRLCDAYFDYIGSGVFPGGCFFVYTSLDPALRRPSVRERLAEEQRQWLALIEQLVGEAQERGEIPPSPEPERFAFEIDAILIGADSNFVLLQDARYLAMGRVSIRRLLGLDRDFDRESGEGATPGS